MVVDILTSSQEQVPPLMEEGGRDSLPALCTARCGGRCPGVAPQASPFHRLDDPGSLSASGGLKTVMTQTGDGASSSEKEESHEDGVRGRHRQPDDKTTRSCKRKLALTSLSSRSHDAQDSEKKDPESPPPPKRWVIGPLLQSFKSKMASFTEIVMSPVRLFKPNEVPAWPDTEAPPGTHGNKEDVATDSKESMLSGKKEKITPVAKLPVVQRLCFDSRASDGSESETHKASIPQNGSEHGQDSAPEDDGSFELLNSASTRRSTDLTTEARSKESMNPCSVRTSFNRGKQCETGPGSGKAMRELIVLCKRQSLGELTKRTEQESKSQNRKQDRDLPSRLRLPASAVRTRKKVRGLERRELARRKGKEGTERAEESSAEASELPMPSQTRKRRKVQVSDECLGTCSDGDVPNAELNSCDTSKREDTGQLARASRSRSKREKVVTCTLVALDVTSDHAESASIDLKSTSGSTPAEAPPSSWDRSRTTRRHRKKKACGGRKSDLTESCHGDPDECKETSDAKLLRRNNIRQAKHKAKALSDKKPQVSEKSSNTMRAKIDKFEDQGMSMSLTVKVGSGMDGEKDTDSIVTCKIKTKGRKTGTEVMLVDASCPSRATPENRLCAKGDRSTDVRVENLEKNGKQRRWCVHVDRRDGQEEVEQEDDSKAGATASGRGSKRLKRSLSCPDMASLRNANDKTLAHPSPLKKAAHFNIRVPSPIKRARRHTVCSVEIEREIAPLCLRKEVYPKCGATSHPPYAHSPSRSLTSLVSCFLSSPLVFLSRKSIQGHADVRGYGAGNSDLVSAASSSPPSQPSANSPASSGVADGSTFSPDALRTPEQSSMSSHCSASEFVSTEVDEGVVQRESEKHERSSTISEERALSDSEIKTDSKQMEQRKVSSIRIRKTLPKPQYNLTPMGLPKAVRIKKKVFSVEEIYTNKNFSKPPEGRLETIFEVPLSLRDGSQSLTGPKRVKRFVEFPELGVARKPRRPLVGGLGGGGAPRKAAMNSTTGRTRRGREGEALHLQDVDSRLCSKLSELDVWMATEQLVY